MNRELPQQKILIVDDVPTNIRILGEALRSEYEIYFATNGEDSLKIASSENPDLILLDIMMPGMDGHEVCKRIKEDKSTQNIPVIFITAKNEEEDETRGLELGAVDYITKPFSLPIVKARVKTHLELKRHRDILESLSSLDCLTGIPNRRYFNELLDIEWRRALRREVPLSLIMIDIDYFKRFNDTKGHCAGDDCLRLVARTLAGAMRRRPDFVARYGGEEFAAVLPETDAPGALAVAERMRSLTESLNIPHPASAVSHRITVSLGASCIIPTRESSPSVLVQAADKALYEAKAEGRNQSKYLDHLRP